MDGTARIARKAWLALLKGVRAAHLYSAEHSEVDRWIGEFVRLLDLAGSDGPLLFGFQPGRVELAGVPLLDTSGERITLIDRLAADGVRSFQFHGGFDKVAGLRLLSLLAPYAYSERAPMQPLSDRLHWEAFDGLTIQVQLDEDAGGLDLDALTGRELWWREVLCDLLHVRDLPPVALEAVWDGTRGRISWPPTAPRRGDELAAEVDDVVARRATAARVGENLAAAVRAWQDDARVERLLRPLPMMVRELLDRGRAGDVGYLLGPLLRWAGAERRPSRRPTLRDRVQALGGVLLDEENLRRLTDLVRDGRARPADVAGWFAPLSVVDLGGILGFASTLVPGACREALIEGCTQAVGGRSVLLRPVLLAGPVEPALAAFEVIERLKMSRETVGLALEVIIGGSSELVVRAIGYMMPLRSRTIASRLLPLLVSDVAEVRSGALTYMARYAYRPAFDALRDLTEGGLFGGLPLAQRLDICRTLGIVGGIEAEALARGHLPTGWARLDPDRSLPWVVCLAAAGSPAAPEYLEPAAAGGLEVHRSVARDALQLWRRRVEARRNPAPPVRSAPGAPIPVPLTDPGRSFTDGLRAQASWSHRAPLRSGQWSLSEEPGAGEDG